MKPSWFRSIPRMMSSSSPLVGFVPSNRKTWERGAGGRWAGMRGRGLNGRPRGRTPIISWWDILPLSSLSNIQKALFSRAICASSSRSNEKSSSAPPPLSSILFCIWVGILRKGFFTLSRL